MAEAEAEAAPPAEKLTGLKKWRRAVRQVATYAAVDNYLVKSTRLLRFGCGCDGGKVSHKALAVMGALANANRGDQVYTIHVEKEGAEPVTGHLSPSYIKNDADLELRKHGFEEPVWYQVQREESQPVHKVLSNMADKLKLDFLCIGWYGGKKEMNHDAPTDDNMEHSLGTVSERAIRNADTSIVMVKSTSFALDDEKRVFVLATDHSDAAQAAFALIVRRLAKKSDHVYVVYVSGVVSYSTKTSLYEELLKEEGIEGGVDFISTSGDQSVASCVCDYAKRKEADFLCMGLAGYGHAKLGSVSLDICRQARCTCILIKDPRVVKDQRRVRASKPAATLDEEPKTE